MRVGSLGAPVPCGCNFCLAIGRLLPLGHAPDLLGPPVAYVTDRLRVLHHELLDIRAQRACGVPILSQGPTPVAAGL